MIYVCDYKTSSSLPGNKILFGILGSGNYRIKEVIPPRKLISGYEKRKKQYRKYIALAWFEDEYERFLKQVGIGRILEILSSKCGVSNVAKNMQVHAVLLEDGDLPVCHLIANALRMYGVEVREINESENMERK